MTKTAVKYFLFILLVSGPVYAQDLNFKFEHLTVKDGLSSNKVLSILQDNQGFMWFGTAEGLNRYDGYTIKEYRHDPADITSLSANYILERSIYEDRQGIIWVGTRTGGLNRFDRVTETFKHYRHDPEDSLSISNDTIYLIFEDQAGNLWIGTDDGLNIFDQKTGKFTRYKHNPDDSASLTHNRIWDICEIGQGDDTELWIATHNGLDKFNRSTKNFNHIPLDHLQTYGYPLKPITRLYYDQRETLWIGSFDGLTGLNIKTGYIKHFQHDPNNTNSLSFNLLHDIRPEPGSNGRILWLKMEPGYGLDRFETATETFTNFRPDPSNPHSLNTVSATCLYEDRFQRLWIGTHDKGINILPLTKQNFKYSKRVPVDLHSTGGRYVRVIFKDRDGILWVGTDFGLGKLDRERGKFTYYTPEPGKTGVVGTIVGANVITGIAEDHHGMLWLCTWGGGLLKFDPRTAEFQHYKHDPNNANSPASRRIGRVYRDRSGTIWMGAAYEILSRLDVTEQNKLRFTHYLPEPGHQVSLTSTRVFIIHEDRFGGFWVGSHLTGLYRFDRETEQFTAYKHDPKNHSTLSSNVINAIVEYPSKQDSILWIATENGLNRFDQKTENFTRFYNQEPGTSNNISEMATDTRGNLWMKNEKGVATFDVRREKFKNFTVSDTYLDTHPGTADGYIVWPWVDGGLLSFHPDSISYNTHIPPVVLTDFKVLHESAELDSSITVKKRVDLTYDQNFFSFEFAALDYTDSKKNQYAYKLEGLDQDWIESGNRRFANYTAIPSGEYTFRVKGSNNDALWNEEGRYLKILINPPPWRTAWAYLLYISTLGALLFGIRRYELKRRGLKHELLLEHEHSKKLQEIDHIKSRFFANISHEFRTPLTLILGPVQSLISRAQDKKTRNELSLVQRNAQRLQRLINQLLDLSKLEEGSMTLQAHQENIVALVRQFTQSFESLARNKRINFKIDLPEIEIQAWVDRDKIEKIFGNLLSNAFKFTAEGGNIVLALSLQGLSRSETKELTKQSQEIGSYGQGLPQRQSADRNYDNGFIQISISDTGIGIPANRIDKIFDRFYQVDDTHKREREGSGIGLALTKELVELHHGEIGIESEPDTKTTFTVLLPHGKGHLREDEIVEISEQKVETEFLPSKRGLREVSLPDTSTSEEESRKLITETEKPKKLHIILIVDDNEDMRQYIRSNMENNYKLMEAENGEQGLVKATELIPDLILSDVMMPKIDGFEFCAKIKNDERTSHIPVILLTARASKESKVEGLETGADDYLIKPFDAEELNVRVKNLIIQRQKLREKFTHEIKVQPKDITVTPTDEKFLLHAINIVEKNMSNYDFDIDTFCSEMAMSRSTLNRKLRALTDLSTNGFIRVLRLKRASQLLQKKNTTVVEIAYEVGFNNPSYFAECFRQQFGKSPSEYTSN